MITINTAKVDSDIKALKDASKQLRTQILGEEVMTALAEQGVTLIHARTSSGRDADGRAFAAYTPAYAKARAKKGRGSLPDLTFTGRMLASMASKFVAAGKAAVIFTRGEEANKAAGNSNKRDFFDLRLASELEALGRELDRQVQRTMSRLGLT